MRENDMREQDLNRSYRSEIAGAMHELIESL